MKIGQRFERCTFESYTVPPGSQQALDAVKDIAQGTSTGVILTGLVGTGKTHLLAALAHDFFLPERIEDTAEGMKLHSAKTVEYWSMLDLAAILREEAVGEKRDTGAACRQCSLLILDDLGQERSTAFVVEELERIFDYRYREMLPIAISTNLSPKALQAKYGDRPLSRWAEQCRTVSLKGTDYRLLQKKKGN